MNFNYQNQNLGQQGSYPPQQYQPQTQPSAQAGQPQSFNPYAQYDYSMNQGFNLAGDSYVQDMGEKPAQNSNLLVTLLKAAFIGILVSLVVFGILNYDAIYAQISDYLHRNDENNINVEDSDKDGMPDWWEEKYGLDKDNASDAEEDPDEDLLTNLQEYKFDTDPKNSDTDGDGVSDGEEVRDGYDPNKAGTSRLDTDDDGMPDFWEELYGLNKDDPNDREEDPDQDELINVAEFKYKTDPNNSDTDGDGKLDGQEVIDGYDPAIPGKARLRGVESPDTDNDSMPDWWEDIHGLDANDPSDKDLDPDLDQLANHQEWFYDTDPNNPDTDGDGTLDGPEVIAGYDPTIPGNALLVGKDTDGDGITDQDELDIYSTDPRKKDTDGDGMADGNELDIGRDPTGEGNISATIVIPKIGVTAPIVWAEKADEDSMQDYLRDGVVHYPGTAAPGRTASVDGYVTGHSSYYKWDPGKYKYVFQDLYKLEVGDTFYFEYSLKNGRSVRFDYRTVGREIVTPDDPKLFQSSSTPVITLVSCHPPGTSWKRVMYRSEIQE